jgi:hypothetical protein
MRGALLMSKAVILAFGSSKSNNPMLTSSTNRTNSKKRHPPSPLSFGSFSKFMGFWIITTLPCGAQFG